MYNVDVSFLGNPEKCYVFPAFFLFRTEMIWVRLKFEVPSAFLRLNMTGPCLVRADVAARQLGSREPIPESVRP